MLVRDRKEFNTLLKVFDYNGYTLYSLKNNRPLKEILPTKTDKERVIFTLKGSLTVNGINLTLKDMMYIPVDSRVEISLEDDAVTFIAEASGTKKFASYVKKYRDAPRLSIGQPTFRRSVVSSISEREPANRLIAGYVEDTRGEWSSYPPHKHDDKPEAYIFYGIDPGFAVQLVIDGKDERAYVVHDYDTVLIPKGYHPHVNTSLKEGAGYAWVIAAPENARNMEVTIHPAFKEVNLGKSHLSIK